jgi:hypothetical protein
LDGLVDETGVGLVIELAGQPSQGLLHSLASRFAPQLGANPGSFVDQIRARGLLDTCNLIDAPALALLTNGSGPGGAVHHDFLSPLLGLGQTLLGLSQGGSGLGKALFRIFEIGKNAGATTLKNAA